MNSFEKDLLIYGNSPYEGERVKGYILVSNILFLIQILLTDIIIHAVNLWLRVSLAVTMCNKLNTISHWKYHLGCNH